MEHTLPVLLFRDIATSDFYEVWDTKYVLFCFLATLASIIVIWVLAELFYRDKDAIGEFIQASYRSSAAVLVLSFTGPGGRRLGKVSLKKSLYGIATNPIILGILLGMLVSICRIDFPAIIDKTINNVSVLATPLALIGLGVLLPGIFLPLAIYMDFRGEKLVAILIMLGAPTTVSCYIMAKNMGHEGTLTSSTVVATTFLSSITMTIWLFLLKAGGFI